MALVKFITGTSAQFTTLTTKDADTLYFITDTHEIYKGSELYATSEKYDEKLKELTEGIAANTTDITGLKTAVGENTTKISTLETTVAAHTESLTTIEGGEDTEGSVKWAYDAGNKAAKAVVSTRKDLRSLEILVDELKTDIGEKVASVTGGKGITVSGETANPTVSIKLSTVAGNGLTCDNNGLYMAVPDKASTYTIEKDDAPSDEYAAVYRLKKDGSQVGASINIPKDMVVSSGEVVTLEAGNAQNKDAGTYLVLTLANATNDKVYIPVNSLIEYVISGSADSDKVQIAVSEDHKVTASIKAGSIELSDLVANVQTTINSAVQNTRTIADKTLDHDITKAELLEALNVADGAEVNQNAFSKVKVGLTTITAADKTDTVEIDGGTHITVTPDADTKKITIDTKGLETEGTAQGLINDLNYTDSQFEQYVTEVNQVNGKIEVKHANIQDMISENCVTDVTSGDGFVNVEKLGSRRKITITGVATEAQGTNADNAIEALTWGTL